MDDSLADASRFWGREWSRGPEYWGSNDAVGAQEPSLPIWEHTSSSVQMDLGVLAANSQHYLAPTAYPEANPPNTYAVPVADLPYIPSSPPSAIPANTYNAPVANFPYIPSSPLFAAPAASDYGSGQFSTAMENLLLAGQDMDDYLLGVDTQSSAFYDPAYTDFVAGAIPFHSEAHNPQHQVQSYDNLADEGGDLHANSRYEALSTHIGPASPPQLVEHASPSLTPGTALAIGDLAETHVPQPTMPVCDGTTVASPSVTQPDDLPRTFFVRPETKDAAFWDQMFALLAQTVITIKMQEYSRDQIREYEEGAKQMKTDVEQITEWGYDPREFGLEDAYASTSASTLE